MTVLEVIQRSADFLAKKGVDSPRLQIESLLAHVLNMPRLNLYLNFERPLASSEIDRVRALVKRRANREPLQHIIGSVSFCGLELAVTPDVLIPRPETELLADRAAQFLKALEPRADAPVSVLDFGTGTGCLAIYLARQSPTTRVLALDVSPAALQVARDNAARQGVAGQIQFLEGDGLDALPENARFDLIVSNPPYIPTAEIDTLAPEVRDHDPRLALDGGADGLKFYRDLGERTGALLHPGGRMLCEFGDGQAEAIRAIFTGHGWRIEAIEPDYAGRPRIVIARRAES